MEPGSLPDLTIIIMSSHVQDSRLDKKYSPSKGLKQILASGFRLCGWDQYLITHMEYFYSHLT